MSEPLTAMKKKRHIIPISGKDSLCTAIVQTTLEPDLDYEYLFCDVGVELPETYEWLDKVEHKLGIKIHRIGKSLTDLIENFKILPNASARFCTKHGKIVPMKKYLGADAKNSTVYLGIRADEKHRALPKRAPDGGNYLNSYPLVKIGIDIHAVYEMLSDRDLLPPQFFWQRLYDDVLTEASIYKKTIEEMKPWQKNALFSWRSRSNCYFCFFQRRYEWAGLLEHHPQLFQKAMNIETEVNDGTYYEDGDFDSEKKRKYFTWVSGLRLSDIQNNIDKYYDSRKKQVINSIAKMSQMSLIFMDDVETAVQTSCGVFCGK